MAEGNARAVRDGEARQSPQPSRSGHTFSDITNQGDARGHFGDQNQNMYNDQRKYYFNITFNCGKNCSHDPNTVEFSAGVGSGKPEHKAVDHNVTARRKGRHQRSKPRPESEPGTDTSESEQENGQASALSQRAQLTIRAPLREKDESLLVGALERAGYDANVPRALVDRLKALRASNESALALGPFGRHEEQTQRNAGSESHGAGSPLAHRRTNTTPTRSDQDGTPECRRHQPLFSAEEISNISQRRHDVEAMARNYRVDLARLSLESRDKLAQLPREEISRRLLAILRKQNGRTYVMVVSELRRRAQSLRENVEDVEDVEESDDEVD